MHNLKRALEKPKALLGVQSHLSINEAVIASVGALLAIFLTYISSAYLLDWHSAVAILPSMGAAAVLLFATPHGPMAQPWALFIGNGVSAFAGVLAASLIEHQALAAGVAVGLAVALMFLFRAVHPPGGATALAAVIGGEHIQSLGFDYILWPTLLNCLLMFVVAILLNNCFAWRRYPLGIIRYQQTYRGPSIENQPLELSLVAIDSAMGEVGANLEMSAAQIKAIADAALLKQRQTAASYLTLELGAFYTNAKPGQTWSVRQIIDENPHDDPAKHMIIYRVVDGAGKHRNDSCSGLEFGQWAKERVRSVSEG